MKESRMREGEKGSSLVDFCIHVQLLDALIEIEECIMCFYHFGRIGLLGKVN